MARPKKYDKSFIVNCEKEVYEAFKEIYPNVNEAIRNYMEEAINNLSKLHDKELKLVELKKQLDILLATIKALEIEIKKDKELENNEELKKERLNKAIDVCYNKYKVSEFIGITYEEIKAVAKANEVYKYDLINAMEDLEEKNEIKILNKYEIEAIKLKRNKEKRDNKYKPDKTALHKVFNRLNNYYTYPKNNFKDPNKFLLENKERIENFIEVSNKENPSELISYEEIEKYFIENHNKISDPKK